MSAHECLDLGKLFAGICCYFSLNNPKPVDLSFEIVSGTSFEIRKKEDFSSCTYRFDLLKMSDDKRRKEQGTG